jgi:hypothetical protein
LPWLCLAIFIVFRVPVAIVMDYAGAGGAVPRRAARASKSPAFIKLEL